jgi:hypothetical protein
MIALIVAALVLVLVLVLVRSGTRPLVPLMVVATVCTSILGGASIPMMIVDRPAWHSIGAVAYTEYARATDFDRARFIYIPLAWGGALLVSAAMVMARRSRADRRVQISLATATACAWLVLAMTAGAAPNLLRALASPHDEAVLAPLLARFVAWSIPRAVFLVGTFWAMLSALAMQTIRRQVNE